MTSNPVELYNNVYADFAGSVEFAIRRETYGEDMGQSSWLTVREWLEFADQLQVGSGSEVLEIGSGSGGPAVYLAIARDCRVVGVDINEHGVRNAARLAETGGVADRVRFQAVDAGRPLPFPDASFDAVISNDAMCHIEKRLPVLQDWYRVLRPGGRALFTDAMVLTGAVSHEELAVRTSIGFYLVVPPGENERLIEEVGFELLGTQDVTANALDLSRRWHDARAKQSKALIGREGQANFEGLQRFLTCVHTLSAERRLSRFAYLARKPAP